MKLVGVISIVIAGTVLSDSIVHKDCGSVSGTIQSVDVKPCPQTPCKFVRDTTASFTVVFTANKLITNATTRVFGMLYGMKVPFPVPADACDNMDCQSPSGSTVVYKNSVYIKKAYPSVRVVVQWEVLDQDGQYVMCFQLPVQIVG